VNGEEQLEEPAAVSMVDTSYKAMALRADLEAVLEFS